MLRYMKALEKLAYAFKVAATIGAVGMLAQCQSTASPPPEGASFLKEKGFVSVTGGERTFSFMCGKGVVARSYKATDAQGKQHNKTVCFGLFGPFIPLHNM